MEGAPVCSPLYGPLCSPLRSPLRSPLSDPYLMHLAEQTRNGGHHRHVRAIPVFGQAGPHLKTCFVFAHIRSWPLWFSLHEFRRYEILFDLFAEALRGLAAFG